MHTSLCGVDENQAQQLSSVQHKSSLFNSTLCLRRMERRCPELFNSDIYLVEYSFYILVMLTPPASKSNCVFRPAASTPGYQLTHWPALIDWLPGDTRACDMHSVTPKQNMSINPHDNLHEIINNAWL